MSQVLLSVFFFLYRLFDVSMAWKSNAKIYVSKRNKKKERGTDPIIIKKRWKRKQNWKFNRRYIWIIDVCACGDDGVVQTMTFSKSINSDRMSLSHIWTISTYHLFFARTFLFSHSHAYAAPQTEPIYKFLLRSPLVSSLWLYGVQLIRYRKSQLRKKKINTKKSLLNRLFFCFVFGICHSHTHNSPTFFSMVLVVVVARNNFSFGKNRMQRLGLFFFILVISFLFSSLKQNITSGWWNSPNGLRQA